VILNFYGILKPFFSIFKTHFFCQFLKSQNFHRIKKSETARFLSLRFNLSRLFFSYKNVHLRTFCGRSGLLFATKMEHIKGVFVLVLNFLDAVYRVAQKNFNT
jgi:hypothetical protein